MRIKILSIGVFEEGPVAAPSRTNRPRAVQNYERLLSLAQEAEAKAPLLLIEQFRQGSR